MQVWLCNKQYSNCCMTNLQQIESLQQNLQQSKLYAMSLSNQSPAANPHHFNMSRYWTTFCTTCCLTNPQKIEVVDFRPKLTKIGKSAANLQHCTRHFQMLYRLLTRLQQIEIKWNLVLAAQLVASTCDVKVKEMSVSKSSVFYAQIVDAVI